MIHGTLLDQAGHFPTVSQDLFAFLCNHVIFFLWKRNIAHKVAARKTQKVLLKIWKWKLRCFLNKLKFWKQPRNFQRTCSQFPASFKFCNIFSLMSLHNMSEKKKIRRPHVTFFFDNSCHNIVLTSLQQMKYFLWKFFAAYLNSSTHKKSKKDKQKIIFNDEKIVSACVYFFVFKKNTRMMLNTFERKIFGSSNFRWEIHDTKNTLVTFGNSFFFHVKKNRSSMRVADRHRYVYEENRIQVCVFLSRINDDFTIKKKNLGCLRFFSIVVIIIGFAHHYWAWSNFRLLCILFFLMKSFMMKPKKIERWIGIFNERKKYSSDYILFKKSCPFVLSHKAANFLNIISHQLKTVTDFQSVLIN